MARTKDPHAATVKAWKTRKRNRKETLAQMTDEPERATESAGLGRWTKEGRWIPNDTEAAKTWGKTKGVGAGDVPIPFPVWTAEERGHDPAAKDWWKTNRRIDRKAPMGGKARSLGTLPVKLADLIATQHVVLESQVARLAVRASKGLGPSRNPVILRVGGKSFIYDGHHRSSGAKVAGHTTILAEVFELD